MLQGAAKAQVAGERTGDHQPPERIREAERPLGSGGHHEADPDRAPQRFVPGPCVPAAADERERHQAAEIADHPPGQVRVSVPQEQRRARHHRRCRGGELWAAQRELTGHQVGSHGRGAHAS